MLRLMLSNRFEILLASLLDRLASERCAPLEAQQVIIPSSALRRRVELACADHLGIGANLKFSYLGEWVWLQISRLIEIDVESPFTPPALAWRIYEVFGDTAFVARHARLAAYLHDADPLMRFELAQRVAQLIEAYVTYRPAWLAAWSAGQRAGLPATAHASADDEAWQAALWRRLAGELGTSPEHPAATFFREIERRGAAATGLVGLPTSASLFCLQTLPPLYLDILQRLARWVDLKLFVLNPCREYWFEIVDRKRLGYLAQQGRLAYHESGNALLAAWGGQTQAHVDLLLGDAAAIVEEDSVFLPAASNCLLAQLQNAILELRELEPGSIALAADDRSLEIHVCHSLTRQLEVLHDQLLALFAAPDPPALDQILVAVPDLSAAAPLIDAVFGTVPINRRIPYAITGLPARRSNPLARVLDDLLALCASRFTASSVFALLLQPAVAARFALTSDDLELIRGWMRETRMCWGLDGRERCQLQLPDGDQHSFADGMHRLFLAYALGDQPQASRIVVGGRIAAGNPEGSDALTLGRWWRFLDALAAQRDEWARAMDADGWQQSLSRALMRFALPDNEQIEDLRAVQAAIATLHGNMSRGDTHTPVPLRVIHQALQQLFDDHGRGGVPSGVLSFSSLASLRALPYRIVCLLGLDDGVFPSNTRPLEFDLIALRPARGDRQARIDERNLFLDLVLAAGERLYLSYSGRSVRDNSVLPPSVLLAELRDYVALACADNPDDADSRHAARRRLTVEHPLQAFSPAYFRIDADPRRRSFNADYCQALAQTRTARATTRGVPPASDDELPEASADQADAPFFSRALDPPPAEWRQVSLDQLLRFFHNPCRTLLVQRLNIALAAAEDELPDEEPFLSDYAARQALAGRILPAALAGSPADELLRLALAGNEFPAGPLGERMLDEEVARLSSFAEQLRVRLTAAPLPPVQTLLNFRISDEDWQLSGAFGDLRPAGLVRYRYDDRRASDYLAAWINHLFLCAAAPDAVSASTYWHARDGSFHLRPCLPDRARAHLRDLLALYRRGLVEPLHFFPKSAWAYVSAKNGDAAARQRWFTTAAAPWGEQDDAAYRLALRGLADPLDADFIEHASRIFGVLREHLEEEAQ